MRLAILAAASIAIAGATAAEPSNVLVVQGGRLIAGNQRLVHYGDLQLANSTDQRLLRERVGLAIADLCDPSHFSVADPHGSMTCTKQAWTDVQPRMRQLSVRLAAR